MYKIPGAKTILVMGDSRTGYGINDSLLDNAYNLSSEADAPIFSYEKLRKVLPLNPNIRTVVLSVSEQNIQQGMINFDNTSFINKKIRDYFQLMTTHELLYIFTKNPEQVLKSIIGLPKYTTPICIKILRSKKKDIQTLGIGGYYNLYGFIDIKRDSVAASNKEGQFEISQSQLDYLHKIVALCKSYNVKIIFIRTPTHKLFSRKNDATFFNVLNAQFGAVSFKDYSNMDLPDSCYFDLKHLNYYGAQIFTDSVRQFLKTQN